jgi:hypothetical protein
MVKYDPWSYMTMFGILEAVFIALRERIQIDKLLFKESREEQASLQENIQLTVHVYLKMVVQDLVFV